MREGTTDRDAGSGTRNTDRYGKYPSRYSVIHADLHPGNVPVNGNTLSTIDFVATAWGWHIYDLAAALNQCQEFPDFGAYYAACVAGYRKVEPICEKDLAMLPLFLLARGVAEIGWIADRPENAKPAERAAMKDFVIGAMPGFSRRALVRTENLTFLSFGPPISYPRSHELARHR